MLYINKRALASPFNPLKTRFGVETKKQISENYLLFYRRNYEKDSEKIYYIGSCCCNVIKCSTIKQICGITY